MWETITIARPYAQAIFAVAKEEDNLSEWSKTLTLLEWVVSDAQMKAILANPKFDTVAVCDFILSICGQRLDAAGHRLVKLLADAQRLPFVPAIHKLYEQLRTEAEGIVEVDVVSAYELSAAQQASISKIMAKRFGKKVRISKAVDSSLVGGVLIRSGDTVIDASIKGRLQSLASHMIG